MAKRKTAKATARTTRPKKKRPSKRLCELIIIWGRNGTGKSTIAKKMVDRVPGRKIIVTKFGAPKIWHKVPAMHADNPAHYEFKAETRQIIAGLRQEKDYNDTFVHVHQNYRNGLLIMDDCKQYFSADTSRTPGLTDILAEYRHLMLDVFVIVHGPGQLPPKIWDHASGVVVMSTARLPKRSQADVEAYDEIVAAQKRVNAQFKAALTRQDDSHYGIHEFIRL